VTRAPAPADTLDADLAERAAAGDSRAFAELYRRHAEAAWRMAYAVTGNREDAADTVSDAFTRVLAALPAGRLRDGGSFRAYLLTATRRAGIDCLRKRNRTDSSGDAAEVAAGQPAPSSATPTERLLEAADSALIAAAFKGLPERWRSVLWLTEVEQIPARDAAALLGLSPNGVAQLAVRARNGLRERYLQAHIGTGQVPASCRFTVERLGAYVGGGLAPRDLAKVDQHLAGCEPCRARAAELEELGSGLRRAIIPLPIGLAGLALKRWRFHGGLSAGGRLAHAGRALAGKAEKPLAAATVALFAAGLAGLTVVGRPGGGHVGTANTAAPRAGAEAQQPVQRLGNLSNDLVVLPAPVESLSSEHRMQTSARLSTPPGAAPGIGDRVIDIPVDDVSHTPPPPQQPAPKPTPTGQLQLTLSGGSAATTASVAAGSGDGSCTGAAAGSTAFGCTPPPAGTSVITVQSGGSALPSQVIGLP
jgi:RNA polymerase sigma factor (sigma-70 family)